LCDFCNKHIETRETAIHQQLFERFANAERSLPKVMWGDGMVEVTVDVTKHRWSVETSRRADLLGPVSGAVDGDWLR
jgi:hypothetical protein